MYLHLAKILSMSLKRWVYKFVVLKVAFVSRNGNISFAITS
ncbi:methyltransferase type 12 domain protein [Vibrio parahaemolyticus V-223/04]|nr:methyltransferase type 12 domain protein [Vibrio parahaemolyticus V-223/04]